MSDLVILILALFFGAMRYLAAHAWVIIPVLMVTWLFMLVPYERLNARTHEAMAVVPHTRDRVRPLPARLANGHARDELGQKVA